MSHLITVKTRVRDAAAVAAACARLKIAAPQTGKATIYGKSYEGLVVHLPDWTYPVVFDLATGEAKYDNYQGRWGDQKRLDALLQAYAVEKAKTEARAKGHVCVEQTQADGSIKLQIQVM